MTKRYVIIGAGHAGRRMAESLRELDEDAIIIMVGEEVEIPYDRPALSKEGLCDVTSFPAVCSLIFLSGRENVNYGVFRDETTIIAYTVVCDCRSSQPPRCS